jgi:hypothetical protein
VKKLKSENRKVEKNSAKALVVVMDCPYLSM